MDSTQSEGAGRAWVALDLFRADVDPSGLADALARLFRQVRGVTLLSDAGTVDAPGRSCSRARCPTQIQRTGQAC